MPGTVVAEGGDARLEGDAGVLGRAEQEQVVALGGRLLKRAIVTEVANAVSLAESKGENCSCYWLGVGATCANRRACCARKAFSSARTLDSLRRLSSHSPMRIHDTSDNSLACGSSASATAWSRAPRKPLIENVVRKLRKLLTY